MHSREGDAQLAPAVQFFVAAENTVFLAVIKGAGLYMQCTRAKASGVPSDAQSMARSWLSYVTDVVSADHQSCRSILVATHRDKAEQDKTLEQDTQALNELCLELQAAYPRARLSSQPLFVNALDRKHGRPTLWASVQLAADELLRGQTVPKFINACGDFMETYVQDPSTPKWCNYQEFLQLPMVKDLTLNQQGSAFASLRKMGYIIELPNGTIIMKPRWFAAAATVTLSPRGCASDVAEALYIHTDPRSPGFITDHGLKEQLLRLTTGTEELEYSRDMNIRAIEVDKLVQFLAEIGILIRDPVAKVLHHASCGHHNLFSFLHF